MKGGSAVRGLQESGKALSESRTRDFWKSAGSKRRRCASAPVIDNILNDRGISELFSSKMEALLNSSSNFCVSSDLLREISAP